MLKALVLAVASLLTATAAQAGFINFETDSTGAKGNGFVSTSGGGVSFSDSLGANLQVSNFGVQGRGKSLAVFNDDGSKLVMNFTGYMSTLELAFGNDDSCCSAAGNLAWLVLFNGTTKVGSASVVMNRNDVMDQVVSFSGSSFNRAEFFYGNAEGGTINLIEIVDDIRFTDAKAVPLPGTLSLLGAGVLALRASRRRSVRA